jgi:hypothetical protein
LYSWAGAESSVTTISPLYVGTSIENSIFIGWDMSAPFSATPTEGVAIVVVGIVGAQVI